MSRDLRTPLRLLANHAFTGATIAAAAVLVAALVMLLTPIIAKGLGAIFFHQTVEYSRMELELFGRGDSRFVAAETQTAQAARQPVYDLLERYAAGTELERNVDLAKENYRQLRQVLREKIDSGEMSKDQAAAIQDAAREIRKLIIDAVEEEDDLAAAAEGLRQAVARAGESGFDALDQHRQAALASAYLANIENTTPEALQMRREQLPEIRELLDRLFGPRPGAPLPPLAQNRFGATRMDMARRLLDKLLHVTVWRQAADSAALEPVTELRADYFRGTDIETMLDMLQSDLDRMMRPSGKIYWRYFLDDSTPGHYFGGVGPEILGTLILTLLAMLPALPLGVGAGAYLAGRGRGGVVGVLRIAIDTLAGVPSIVFGLFGLAFFVLWLQPALGLPTKPGILAGGLTLGVLVLPVLIRASEEAIRSVPRGYVEGSLAVGAGPARTFWQVTLPAALPGVLTGLILSISRAAGETAAILFTAAIVVGKIPGGLLEQTRTLATGGYDMAVGDRISWEVPHNQYGMVMTLILLVLGLNAVAIWLRRRVTRKLAGR